MESEGRAARLDFAVAVSFEKTQVKTSTNKIVRLKGYGGPFQSSDNFLMICNFNKTLTL